MNREWLIESASDLKQVRPQVVITYGEISDKLVAAVNESLLNRADLPDLIGKNNIQMMMDNHANHARFMVSIMKHYNADVFVDTVLWVFRAYRSHGFASTYWAAQLNAWTTALKALLQPDYYSEIYPYYNWLLVNIPIFVSVSDAQLTSPKYLN